jgi:diguanylate cyclase (GGDEF)-like protein/PAS domain S-box-containing protein
VSAASPLSHRSQLVSAFAALASRTRALARPEAAPDGEPRFRSVLEDIDLLAVTIDADCRIVFCNDHLSEVTGWAKAELSGRDWYATFGPENRRVDYLCQVATGSIESNYDETLVTRSGEERTIRWSDSVTRDDSGAVMAVTSIGSDVTDAVRAEQRLAHLRDHDDLTGLPNRALFARRVDRALELARAWNRAVAVLFVNLENFRLVNDAYGQAAGDAVLRQFGVRIGEAAHGAAVVARNGLDEFLVLIADLDPPDRTGGTHQNAADVDQMAETVAARVRHAMAAPFGVGGHEVYLSACIGVSQFPADAGNRDELMKAAHVDTYCGMQRPSGRRRRATSGLTARAELSLVARLHHALANDEFVLHYQPIVRLATGEMRGVEALIRWQSPSGELIPPGDFIPVAERTGLIAPITKWVVREVCAQTSAWRRAGIDLEIAFNYPGMLWDVGTISQLATCIRDQGIEPGALTLEVTETTIATDLEQASSALEVVRSLGLRLAIDDFGTGYSSLWRLTQLPVATLKIDRSFVRDLPADETAATMTRTIVRLARNLGIEPLAEGIETEAQRRFLHNLGCELGQGFLFSRAVPAGRIEALLLAGPLAA